ncbi:sensor histidine kinase [Paenibacillus sp. MMS18-CY102]|uniref:sensor histidine kinase n=1 Tax=Paenibacillus sp. MMS18-CY102 TaxID=2682849 RepID=UPI0013654F42|nr:sensor histidine kinase [Paenibacillus sp. MMS18-CY102]
MGLGLLRKKELYGLLLIVVLMIYFVLISMKYTYIGIEAHHINDQDQWVITYISHNSWASEEGLALGDAIVEIDHHPPSDNFTLSTYLKVERIHQLAILHGDVTTSYSIADFQISYAWLMQSLLPLILLLVTLAIGLAFYRKQNGKMERDVAVLIIFSLLVALSYVIAGASARYDRLALLLIAGTFPSIPLVLLHFIYLHAKKNGQKLRMAKLFILFGYAIIGLFTAINAIYIYSGMLMPIPYAQVRSLTLAFFCISIAALLIVSFRQYAASSSNERPVYTILLTGQVIAFFPFVGLVALPKLIAKVQLISPELASACVFFMPIMYLRLLTAKQLLDIDHMLKRLRYFACMAVVPAIVAVGLLLLLNQDDSPWEGKWHELVIVIYAAMMLLLYLKEQVDMRLRSGWLDGYGPFQLSIDRFTSQISRIMKPADLENMLIKEIQAVLRVKSVILLELHMHSEACKIKSAFGSPPDEATLAKMKQAAIRGAAGSFLPIEQGLCYWFASNNETYQLLWIHNKSNRTRFNQDELAWLRTLLNYGTLVYENLLLVDDFIGELEQSMAKDQQTPTWLLRLLFSISENERRRLSTDLHDAALQDQILLYQQLEDLSSRHELSSEAKHDVSRICDGLLDVIDQIRETCNELRPPFLNEMGIIEAIRNLLAKVRLRANYSITLNTDECQAQVKLDNHQALTLYRIVQEMLHNAGKHAKASHIDLILSSSDEQFHIRYADNGVGMNLTQLRSSFSHMGLWSIQERVASLEGTVVFRSEPGQGFQVDIAVPAVSSSHIRAFDARTTG